MKYLLLASVLLGLLIPNAAPAEVVGLYADPLTHYCSVRDVPGPTTLYVIHKFTPGSFGTRFRVEYSSGFTGTLLDSSSPFTVTGDPLSGITVNYDGCPSGSFVVLTLDFMLYGSSPECSWVRVTGHPQSIDGEIDVYDCYGVRSPGYWEGTHIYQNSGGGANCPNDHEVEQHDHFCRPYYNPTVATEPTTWGAIKALYR